MRARSPLNRGLRHASVTLLRLDEQAGAYVSAVHALAGQSFTTDAPFPVSFDPADLLAP